MPENFESDNVRSRSKRFEISAFIDAIIFVFFTLRFWLQTENFREKTKANEGPL